MVSVLVPVLALVSCTTDHATGIKWCQCQWNHMTKNVAPHFDFLHSRNAMMLLMMPSASQDTYASTNGITWLTTHVGPHFHHLELWNIMVPMKTLWASQDANASINGVTWPNRLCHTIFWSFWPKECNGVMADSICIIRCWYQLNHLTKKVMLLLISISWPKECKGAIDVAVCKMWCWC